MVTSDSQGDAAFVTTTEHVEVRVTCATSEQADMIAEHLVAERLAACVHRFPIRSSYRWNGTVERDDEIVLAAITRRARAAQVAAAIAARHDYDVPAITCVDLVAGSPAYLAWVDAET